MRHLRGALIALIVAAGGACDGSRDVVSTEVADGASPRFRNVESPTAYVGDAACASCHVAEARAYGQHAMAQSFHRWTRDARVEAPLDSPLVHKPSGFAYSVADSAGALYQVERSSGGHELRRRIDFVMGSGTVARSYFTEENGRLFQLPLTWYKSHGWDFSPGYEINNARFDRMLPNRCLACHASYPDTLPYLEGKYREVRPGIGCERCHGPGALHVAERTATSRRDTAFDATIVNPKRMSLARRLDNCEQCHVHTAVTVLRDGKSDFSYMPSQPLRDQVAFFKSGGIDIVSHADRLKQSACFLASRASARPLECASCHNVHQPTPTVATRSLPCLSCHLMAKLPATHTATSDCVGCHMPRTDVRTAVHGAFTDHWIRVPGADVKPAAVASAPIEPYFERDRTGSEAAIFQGMGRIVYANLANNAQVLGDGAAMLDSALGADASRAQARFLLGVAYQQLMNASGSIAALERSVRTDSSRPEALRALATAYESDRRDIASTEPLYRRALALQPALAWIRAEYADLLAANGRRADAEREYRSAVAEQPSLSGAWFNLGALLVGAGRSGDAAAAFRQAERLDPSLADALSPLIELRVSGDRVISARALALRHRLSFFSVADSGIVFSKMPPRATVQIFRPDGTMVRDISGARWDFLDSSRRPISSGNYRVRIGRRTFALGIARI